MKSSTDQGKSERLLFISCVPPRAQGIGIEQRAWRNLQTVARHQAPDLVLALTSAQFKVLPELHEVKAVCRSVHVVHLRSMTQTPSHRSSLALIGQRLVRFGQPDLVASLDELQAVVKAIGGIRFERVFCFRLRCFEVWRQLQKLGWEHQRLLVDFDDIESLAQRRARMLAASKLGFVMRVCSWIEERKTTRIEVSALQSAEVFVCSSEDRNRLLERVPYAPVHVLPNSYPLLPQLAPSPSFGTLRILFIGTLSYAPNIDGAQFFCEQVLPLVQQGSAQPVRVAIVGRNPTPNVLVLHKPPEIDVVGEVASIESAYMHADLVVVPIRHGGGTRIKILEALALGRPVVTTTLGCEGLNRRNDVEVLVADSAAEFARACLRLARDPTLAKALVLRGREALQSHFQDTAVQSHLHSLLFVSSS